mmetsp:Transcript_13477/g.29170  ORF Transcript_13477/g.29170 Transcript_13477/m.29170 type:complete len:394 (+) Transcript_13477:1485-2666(+)
MRSHGTLVGTRTPLERQHDVAHHRLSLQISQALRRLIVRAEIHKGVARRLLLLALIVSSHSFRFREAHANAAEGAEGVHQGVHSQRHARIPVEPVQEEGAILGVFRLHCLPLGFVLVRVAAVPRAFPTLLPPVGAALVPRSPEGRRRVLLGQATSVSLRQASPRPAVIVDVHSPGIAIRGVHAVRRVRVRAVDHQLQLPRRLAIVCVHVRQRDDAHSVDEFKRLSQSFRLGSGDGRSHGQEATGVTTLAGRRGGRGVPVRQAGDEATSELGRLPHLNGNGRPRRQVVPRTARGHELRHVVRSHHLQILSSGAAGTGGDGGPILGRERPAPLGRHPLPPLPRKQDVAPQEGDVLGLFLELSAGDADPRTEEADREACRMLPLFRAGSVVVVRRL